MRKQAVLCGVLGLTFFLVSAQQKYRTVVAEKGDGIFSLLRKQGINPSKYYAAFVALNEDNLRNGSELHVGRVYKIPQALDSFVNKGRYIELPDTDRPLFDDDELAKLLFESNTLKDAVYYIVLEESTAAAKPDRPFKNNEIALNLAKRLLSNGAQVYVISDDREEEMAKKAQPTEDYVSLINKRYLKHMGKYQRLLLVRSNGLSTAKNLNVSILHHETSKDGRKLAYNIQEELKKSSKNPSKKSRASVFSDKKNLFLAKNTLPALTIVELTESKLEKGNTKTALRTDMDKLARILTSGIFQDYADLEFED